MGFHGVGIGGEPGLGGVPPQMGTMGDNGELVTMLGSGLGGMGMGFHGGITGPTGPGGIGGTTGVGPLGGAQGVT